MTRKVSLGDSFGFYKGSSRPLEIIVLDSNADDAAPVDITGYTLSFTLKSSKSATPEHSIVKVTPVEVDIPVGTDGRAVVDIPAADRAALDAPKDYYIALQRTDVGDECILMEGTLKLLNTSAVP